MDCLIELYDSEPLNNLIDVFAFRPKKVVFLYDGKLTPFSALKSLENAIKLKLPNLQFEIENTSFRNLETLRLSCKRILNKNGDGSYVDITGGGELSAIGAYLACVDSFTPIFWVDVVEGNLVSAHGCKSMEGPLEMPRLSLDTLLLAHGAAIGGYGHPKPPSELFDPLLTFCDAVFSDISLWKELCFYLQTACTTFDSPGDPLSFHAPDHVSAPGGKASPPNDDLLKLADRLGLIRQFHHKGKTISFRFHSDSVKKYLTDFGTCLELFTFITLCRCPAFHDVRISVKVDWNGMRQQKLVEITNEIDVTLFCGIHPVFISCKLSEPSSEALQELSVYRSYFGGRHSRCILVTLAAIHKDRSYVFARAKEMGITLLDGSVIRSGKLAEAVQQAVANPCR